MQANSLKRELSERVKQQTIDEQRGGCIIQPRWFALRQPGCLGTRAPSASGRDALRFRYGLRHACTEDGHLLPVAPAIVIFVFEGPIWPFQCRFTGEYWQARKTGAWESVPRLFSQEK